MERKLASMLLTRRTVLEALFVSSVGTLAAAAPARSPVIATNAGDICGAMVGNICVFKGVPYGASTGGAQRWLPCSRPQPWRQVRDALDYGPMCPQSVMAPVIEELAVLQKGPMDEDCLRVHIWTGAAGHTAAKLPVMVWFHGGGYAGGSGGATSFDGTRLAAKHNVVVITVTHRVNVFGFLRLPESFGAQYAVSGNVGLLDCVAALEWVRDNVVNFGGDPGNVTVFGQSGGAGKISCLMAMPAARNLFRRAILQSGSQVRAATAAQGAQRCTALVEALGVSTLSQLQALPAAKLVAAAGAAGFQSVTPIVDGVCLPHDPFDPKAPAQSADIPLLAGSNETEATFFAGTPVANTPLDPIDADELQRLVAANLHLDQADAQHLIGVFRRDYQVRDNAYLYQLLATQWIFADGVTTLAERKADQEAAPVYVYSFERHSPVQHGKLRATHTLEIGYVFDNIRGSPIIGPATASEQTLADRLSATWVAFARTGDPNHAGIPYWGPYDRRTRGVMSINREFRFIHDPHRNAREAIAELKGRGAAQGAA
jgi:para-nitrobenzyl esterase